MSLRAQLIGLFVALAIVPLLAVGVIDYARSVDALEDVIASQTAVLTERASAALEDRYSEAASNLSLLAENTATLAMLSSHGVIDTATARYIDRLRQVTRRQFLWISWRDSSGRILKAFDDSTTLRRANPETYVVTQDIRDTGGHVIGRVEAGIRLDSILPRAALNAHFGPGGHTAVADTTTGEYLFPAIRVARGASLSSSPIRRTSAA